MIFLNKVFFILGELSLYWYYGNCITFNGNQSDLCVSILAKCCIYILQK